MRLFKKKKDTPVDINRKKTLRLEGMLLRTRDILGVKDRDEGDFSLFSWFHSTFKDDSPIKILEEKVDLILDHLNLVYISKEDQIEGTKGKLGKWPIKKKGPVIYKKRGIKK